MLWQRLNIGSRVNREAHARFWEQPEVQSLRLTRLFRKYRPNFAIVAFRPARSVKCDGRAMAATQLLPTQLLDCIRSR